MQGNICWNCYIVPVYFTNSWYTSAKCQHESLHVTNTDSENISITHVCEQWYERSTWGIIDYRKMTCLLH